MKLATKNDYILMYEIAKRLLSDEQKEILLDTYRHIKVNKCVDFKIDNHYANTFHMSNDIKDYLKETV